MCAEFLLILLKLNHICNCLNHFSCNNAYWIPGLNSSTSLVTPFKWSIIFTSKFLKFCLTFLWGLKVYRIPLGIIIWTFSFGTIQSLILGHPGCLLSRNIPEVWGNRGSGECLHQSTWSSRHGLWLSRVFLPGLGRRKARMEVRYGTGKWFVVPQEVWIWGRMRQLWKLICEDVIQRPTKSSSWKTEKDSRKQNVTEHHCMCLKGNLYYIVKKCTILFSFSPLKNRNTNIFRMIRNLMTVLFVLLLIYFDIVQKAMEFCWTHHIIYRQWCVFTLSL